ncbi:MAG: hypothetical protein GXO78_08455 [Calditrichaeota bacterium]|nr:hypothetical protein [Calditrichota bacterium]
MRMRLRLLLIILMLIFAAVIALLAGWILWQELQNPVAVLDRSSEGLQLLHRFRYPVDLGTEARVFQDVILWAPDLDTIRITLSFPEGVQDVLPVIFVLGGLEVGRQSLFYIPDHGQNVIVAYEYPYSPHYWYQGTPLSEIPAIRRAALRVPAQILAVWQWIRQQSWADTTRMTLTGYSFGAMFVPAIYHLGRQKGIRFGPTVIVYGGTRIDRLLAHNMIFLPSLVRPVIAFLAARAIYPLEPSRHLSALTGEFLLINGWYDQLVPEWSWMPLQQGIPGQKTILNLPEAHMHPGNPELTRRLVRLSRQWLLERDRIRP